MFQLAGIWPVGDFRLTPAALPSVLLIGLVLVAAIAAVWLCAKRRQWGLLLYPVVALVGCGLVYYVGRHAVGRRQGDGDRLAGAFAGALAGVAMLWSR